MTHHPVLIRGFAIAPLSSSSIESRACWTASSIRVRKSGVKVHAAKIHCQTDRLDKLLEALPGFESLVGFAKSSAQVCQT